MSLLIVPEFLAADTSLGHADYSTFSQQTLMELVISSTTNAEVICGEHSNDLRKWKGVSVNDNHEVTEIFWWLKGLKGTIAFEWLPSTIKELDVSSNKDLKGSLSIEKLPRSQVDYMCKQLFERISHSPPPT